MTKHCKRCSVELKKGATRYSCKECSIHFCHTCFHLPVCAKGHTLEAKTVTASMFSSSKQCVSCRTGLTKGMTRFSCKSCNFHLCPTCWNGVKVKAAGAVAGSVSVTMAPVMSIPAFPVPEPAPQDCKRRACKYGLHCYQKNAAHLERFVHPGDRNYRIGLVEFDGNTQPEFESLWQLFQYHDPDESGHISKGEFVEVMKSCQALAPGKLPPTLEQAWSDAGGPLHGYLNFRQFVSWTQDSLGLEYPLGLENSSESGRPCRFRFMTSGGNRCSCPGFQPAAAGSMLCICGHKTSMHRSDLAEQTFSESRGGSRPEHWEPGKEGLVEISDAGLLAKLQDLLTAAHKGADNWTRDRGCQVHGVNACAVACCWKNRRPVPSSYTLVTAYRNQNWDLWHTYCLAKTAIEEECVRPSEVALEARGVVTSGKTLEAPLDEAYNEWYLFHGTSAAKCRSICSSNFKFNLAGTGATWKDPGKASGVPLYGYGIYFAEHVTKSDEYSEVIPEEEPILPVGEEHDFHVVLLCRVLGGRANLVTTNEIERDKLKADVFAGPYHSVFGDRAVTLKKPYREIVVYDKDQCYPEFLLVYARQFA